MSRMSLPGAQQPPTTSGHAEPGVAPAGAAPADAAPYGASPYGGSAPGGSAPGARARSPLALVSFIIAIANILIGWVLSFAISGAIVSATDSYATVGVLQLVNSVLTVLLALVSLVTGLIALLKRGAPKGFAAAGTALGGAALFGVLMGVAQAAFYQLF
jgi:hypothetical protein